tara:strand:+ start:470 stop:880 length:411 start_codon:yes stop_codon:yes gene_type:complete
MFPKNIDLIKINQFSKNCMVGHLGIEIIKIGKNYIKGKMPVDKRTTQPFGLLHGGASVAFSETLGSFGSGLICDKNGKKVVGIEINANHLKSITKGHVYGIAKPIHIGRRIHVWETKISDEEDNIISISRLTVAVL